MSGSTCWCWAWPSASFIIALFGATLLSLPDIVVDTAICMVFGFWGFRATRARQMAQQYGWIYRRAGQLGWVRANGGAKRRSTGI